MRILFVAVVAFLALIVGGPIVVASQMSAFMMGASGIQQAQASRGATSCNVPMVGAGQSETGVTLPQLTAEQVAVAHAVWTTAHQVGFGDRGALVGIATVAQESTLGANPSTRKPNSDVDVGPMQQRALPGWYANGKTVAENVTILNDPMYAAKTFFLGYKVTAADVAAAKANGTEPAGPAGYTTPGLAQVKGWESMPVTVAAQKVQRSAYPDHYAKHEPVARQLVEKFNAEAPPPAADPSSVAVMNAGEAVNAPLCDPPGATSGDVADCPDSGLAAEKGLTPDGQRVLRCAYQQWPDLTYGGVRQDPIPDHPSGRAIDIMTGGNACSPVGQKIADWAKSNADSLGVQYVIWCSEIWSVQRSSEGWRPNTGHRDHVHISVNGNSAGTSAAPVAEGGSAVVAPVDKYGLSARHGQAGSAWASGFHTGLDLTPIPAGSTPPLKAVKAGTVTAVTTHAAYGNLIKIDHGGGIESWYAHLSTTKVKEGQKVTAGTVIGNMGRTGNVRGTNPEHLHLEIRQGGSPIDPERWMSANGVRLAGSKA